MEQLHFRVVRKELWLHMEENKMNISLFAVEIKSENEQIIWYLLLQGRTGIQKFPLYWCTDSLSFSTDKSFKIGHFWQYELQGQFFCGSASFLVFRSEPLRSQMECTFLHWTAIQSGQRASEFQSHSPQPFLLSLKKEEGTAPLVWIRMNFSFPRQ